MNSKYVRMDHHREIQMQHLAIQELEWEQVVAKVLMYLGRGGGGGGGGGRVGGGGRYEIFLDLLQRKILFKR